VGALSKFRRWANRDDGRLFQVGNESIGATTVAGVLVLIGALILWQLHSQVGIGSGWAIVASVSGLALLCVGGAAGGSGGGT